MKKLMFSLLISVALSFGVVQGVYPFDHAKYDEILKAYVDDQGLVDYKGIAKDERFSDYMKSLESAKAEELSRDGQLAFWINAYNAVTIDKVIKERPKKSVRETLIPGVWTSTKFFETRTHTVAGRKMSQDDIEHEMLRGQFTDPRIHFTLVCASMGCPPIPRTAYTEQNVQTMLEEETRKYLNSERGVRVDETKNKIYLSKIFDWFEGDFIKKSGSVLDFIRPYLREEDAVFLDREPAIAYLDYNWALNAKEPLR